MAELTPASVVVRRAGPLAAEVDGEVVMLDPQAGAYYGLDATGSAIWELLGDPVSVDELCTHLVGSFAVDRPTCERDVLALLSDLLDAGLVEQAGP